jgi:predicted SnoaL-like aldol condensation-catalyzing enzyme
MTVTSPEQNKALVLKAFDTLFNRRDYAAAERFWSDTYIQHSAHIPPGRDGLFHLVRGLPDTLRYENHLILAEGDYVFCHGRFSGIGRPRSWVAADVVRLARRSGYDRNQVRLRDRPVRRVHGIHGRTAIALLLDTGFGTRQQRDHHDRGRQWARGRCSQEGLDRS